MTDTKTPVDNNHNPGEQAQPSDARIILGPLVKYAAMGFVLVGIIVTTAVMLDRQFNTIDQEVAALQAELDKAGRKYQDEIEPGNTDVAAENDTAAAILDEAEPVLTSETVTLTEQGETTDSDTIAVIETDDTALEENLADTPRDPVVSETSTQLIEQQPATETIAADTTASVIPDTDRQYYSHGFYGEPMDAIIAKRNAYLQEMDRIYLEEYRASRQKQLQLMRERLARHQQRITEMEQRYQEMYDLRAADMKDRQEIREHYRADQI
ncbi:MAG: hypothetical protein JSW45_03630 [Thiotrichales bacterium]|nr:MAG: hypothetical protein JSW45_03630 [Thiotrichales bacterium]